MPKDRTLLIDKDTSLFIQPIMIPFLRKTYEEYKIKQTRLDAILIDAIFLQKIHQTVVERGVTLSKFAGTVGHSFLRYAIFSYQDFAKILNITSRTARHSIERLISIGIIVQEVEEDVFNIDKIENQKLYCYRVNYNVIENLHKERNKK